LGIESGDGDGVSEEETSSCLLSASWVIGSDVSVLVNDDEGNDEI
jgi:hypothetical protein